MRVTFLVVAMLLPAFFARASLSSQLAALTDAEAAGSDTRRVAAPPYSMGALALELRQYPYRGMLDEVAFYRRALSPAEVKVHYRSGIRTAARGNRYSTLVKKSRPAGYWRFEDKSGASRARALDSSGRGAHGRYWNGVKVGVRGALRGERSKAARFDGRDDFVQVPIPARKLGASFTLELWAYPLGRASRKLNDYGTLLGADYEHRLLWRASDGVVLAQFRANVFSKRGVRPNAWHHIVYTSNRGRTRLYVDGSIVASSR